MASIVLGVIVIIGGIYAIVRGFDARETVKDKLEEQSITLPEDAPDIVPGAEAGALVDSPGEAEAMAQVINAHALESTGGLTYAEMGRFATEDGDPAGTDDPEEAAEGPNGQPAPNQARNTAFNASALQTSLYSSFMAFELSTLVMGLGLFIVIIGIGMIYRGIVDLDVERRLYGDTPR